MSLKPHSKRNRGRPRKVPPDNVRVRIAALTAAGHDLIGIARALKTSQDTLRRWIDEDPALQEALSLGREIERMELEKPLRRAAKKGNIVAAMFLLKCKHGYREGDRSDVGNRVSINFTLPAALTPEQFNVIEHEATNPALPVSAKSLTRS